MAKVLHQFIQVLGDARNLAFVDTAQAQGLDQVIDFTGADTLDVGLLYHGQQGLFAALARFQQAGEVRPLPQFRYPQWNLAYSGLPQSFAVAIAIGNSLRLALIVPGTPLVQVATLLGHESLDTTRIYTQPSKRAARFRSCW